MTKHIKVDQVGWLALTDLAGERFLECVCVFVWAEKLMKPYGIIESWPLPEKCIKLQCKRKFKISLTAPHCRVSVQSSVAYTEVYYVTATDRPYTFKLSVHTTGKTRHLNPVAETAEIS